MIDFNNNIYLGVASPDMERDLSNYYTKSQTRALVDTKQDIITGAATTITSDNLTANRAVVSNSSGKVAVSSTTSTELGYLSGVTSGVQAQLNGKADTSLSNLSSDGQMVIDSQNGTISNCILEIPQNIKLTLENNVLTLKAGSILTRTGSTYTTVTVTEDKTSTYSDNGKYYIIATADGTLYNWWRFDELGSGSSLPEDDTNYIYFFNITDKKFYLYGENGWYIWRELTQCYPLGIIEVTNGVASFAKDSNGNDLIFNGAGFVGHHAFVYPNVKALIPDGLNADGSLKSISVARSALTIKEILGNQYFSIGSATAINPRPSYFEVNTLDDLYAKNIQGFYYVKSINQCYSWGGGSGVLYAGNYVFIHVNISGTTVTDFAIRQPVRTATTEMTDNIQAQLNSIDNNTVKLTGNQTIAGDKTFSNPTIFNQTTYFNNAVAVFNNGGYRMWRYKIRSGETYEDMSFYDTSNTFLGSIRVSDNNKFDIINFTETTTITPTDDNTTSRQIDTVGARNTKLQGYATTAFVNGYLASITGYDATKTQTLKNVNGTLTWVDDII